MKSIVWGNIFKKKSFWISLGIIFTFGLIAIFAPVLSPHDPYKWSLSQYYLPPMWVKDAATPGTPVFPLGSDYYGRDILSRLIYGTRTAFFLALTAVPLAALIGTLVGMVSGYAGGKIDSAIYFLTEIIQALPGIMFMVIIVLIFKNTTEPTWFNGYLALLIGYATVAWVSLARMIRIQVLQLKSELFIEAAVSIGAKPRRIIWKHLLPNVLHVILVWIINNIPAIILLEALLGYIGIGVTAAIDGGEFNVVSWGGMFYAGRKTINRNPLMLIIPSLCILLLSMSFILLADSINETTRQEEE